MKKKVFCILLILTAYIIFLFSGCGNSETISADEASSKAFTGTKSSGEPATEQSVTTTGMIGTPSNTETHSNTKTQSKPVSTAPSRTSASAPPATSVVPTKITVTEKEITLDLNHSWTIKYKLTPSNASASYITFTSSDKSVVTVSKKGVITPVKTSKGGTATITAALPNGVTAAMKVNLIYHEPADSGTLSDALAKKRISIPSFASTDKLGSGSENEVTCEYAVWANGSNGAKYSNDAYIDMNYLSSPLTVTVTVCVKVNKAPDGGSISFKRDYYGNEKLETINVKTGDLIQKTYTLTLTKGGSNKVYHLTLLRNPLNLSTRVYSISSASASAAFS